MFWTPTESPKNLDLVWILPNAYIPFSGHSAYIADTKNDVMQLWYITKFKRE